MAGIAFEDLPVEAASGPEVTLLEELVRLVQVTARRRHGSGRRQPGHRHARQGGSHPSYSVLPHTSSQRDCVPVLGDAKSLKGGVSMEKLGREEPQWTLEV